MSYKIRQVQLSDAEQILKVYTPFITDTCISFEYTVPTLEEFIKRIEAISAELNKVINYNILGNDFVDIKLDDLEQYDFENKLWAYLKLNYNYSPYKNLEFIDFLYQDAIKNSLKTDHPNHLIVKELRVFS